MKKIVCLVTAASLCLGYIGCDMMSAEDVRSNKGNFTFSAGSQLVGNFTGDGSGLSKRRAARDIAADTIVNGNYYITPLSIVGKAVTLSLKVGSDRFGGTSEIMLSAPDPEGFRETSILSTDPFLEDFDLRDPHRSQTKTATVLVRDNPYPDSADAIVSTVNVLFAWVDYTFVLPTIKEDSTQPAVALTRHTELPDTHTVRIVYADVTDLGYKRGDRLYRDPADSIFKWVDRDGVTQFGENYQSVLRTTRPANPVTEGEHLFMGDGSYIPTFEIGIPHDMNSLALPREDLENYGWEFTITFNVKNSLSFGEVKYVDLDTHPQGLDLKTMMLFFGTRFGGDQSLTAAVSATVTDSVGIDIPDYRDSTDNTDDEQQ